MLIVIAIVIVIIVIIIQSNSVIDSTQNSINFLINNKFDEIAF